MTHLMKTGAKLLLLVATIAFIWAVLDNRAKRESERSKGLQPVRTAEVPAAAPKTAEQPPSASGPSQTPPATPEAPLKQIEPVIEIKSAASTTLPGKTETSAERQALEAVHFAFRDYRNALGENPVGTNAEITKMLLGDNLKQVKIPVPDGSSVNGSGELCDVLGSPYFFHQLSKTQMEIRSAGPDRQMWTADDLLQ